jgi:hypothetical protein
VKADDRLLSLGSGASDGLGRQLPGIRRGADALGNVSSAVVDL